MQSPQVSVTARAAVRNAAPSAVATGLTCVASVSATSLTLDDSASKASMHFFHKMKTPAAQVQTPLCAAAGENALRATASVRSE